jgi:hypothetical protein
MRPLIGAPALDDMSFLGALLITCALAAGGIYVLTHVRKLTDGLQGLYVRTATQKRNRGDWDSSLYIYNPEYWQSSFARFLFKSGVIFVGIWLLLVAITPIGPFFSPIHQRSGLARRHLRYQLQAP